MLMSGLRFPYNQKYTSIFKYANNKLIIFSPKTTTATLLTMNNTVQTSKKELQKKQNSVSILSLCCKAQLSLLQLFLKNVSTTSL